MIEKIQERVDQGDCPTIAPYSVEQLEDLVLTLARSHDESKVMASAFPLIYKEETHTLSEADLPNQSHAVIGPSAIPEDRG
jgi:hypothetical protein